MQIVKQLYSIICEHNKQAKMRKSCPRYSMSAEEGYDDSSRPACFPVYMIADRKQTTRGAQTVDPSSFRCTIMPPKNENAFDSNTVVIGKFASALPCQIMKNSLWFGGLGQAAADRKLVTEAWAPPLQCSMCSNSTNLKNERCKNH